MKTLDLAALHVEELTNQEMIGNQGGGDRSNSSGFQATDIKVFDSDPGDKILWTGNASVASPVYNVSRQ
ncbi:hypothetical protein GCM10027592_39380 [Spirosoma flavus]